jgi:hypothetical protein
LQNNFERNQDLRIKYINNSITEKKFKETLHSRDKKIYFTKNIAQTIMSSYEIGELILWNIVDSIPKINKDSNPDPVINTEDDLSILTNIEKNIELLIQLTIDTNIILEKISDDFKYTTKYKMEKYFMSSFINI